MLRQNLAAPGRLWLALRHLDQAGTGVFSLDSLRQQLTDEASDLRICGKRQVRNLLRAGEGVFWTRDKAQVWLRSAAKVAAALGIVRLAGRPVALPLSALRHGVGTFRAHLYAAFHSGRAKETPRGLQAAPVARETLAHLTGVRPASQRVYEKCTAVRVQANFAVGETLTKETQEQQLWKNGLAVFKLADFHGQQGKPGQSYLAWQLPNTYLGQHKGRPKGQQRRINRKLKDLVKQGTPGNVGKVDAIAPLPLEQRYFVHGGAAVRWRKQSRGGALYWRAPKSRHGRCQLWQVMGT